MTRILIVEDNTDLAEGLRDNLELEGFDVTIASDGRRAVAEVARETPDLIILDLMLPSPEMDGYRVLRKLREEGMGVPILILTARGAVVTQESVLPNRIVFSDVSVFPKRRVVYRGERQVDLRPKEFDLLIALLARDGNAISRKELLQEVWGYGAGTASRTVDTHIGELRRKLEKDPSTPEHILTVRKSGYRLQT